MKTQTDTHRRVRLAGVVLAVGAAAVSPLACNGELTDTVDYLNALISEEGPVPGTIGPLPDDLDPHEANEFAFEGGTTGTAEDTEENLNHNNFRDSGGGLDVPTGAKASPLFGAQPFAQKLLRFEEFGMEPLPASTTAGPLTFPTPPNAHSGPDGAALDAFLAQDIFPYPTRLANITDLNPWKTQIETFIGRTLASPPAEGRPPGEDWAHQRYTEFAPQAYFTVAQAGARTNLGARDARQLHGYAVGEFGPGGLYHNTVGAPGFDGTTDGIAVRFHPNFPVQSPDALWTFDGTFPPKLLMARYGEPLLMRHYNALPIDPAANLGFGLHTISTHEHNGHNPAESDGYTQAFFFPGQFYDYRWPMVLAGHDSINTGATDPRAGMPDGNGGIVNIPGDWRETMSTHWFHDHMLDFTAQNVYKGNAAMMNYYSALDRGNEGLDDGVNLRLPSGTALDWGNRDYDVNLVIADKAWDAAGQLFFNIFDRSDGFVGDQLLVNWLWKPYLDVRARRYRFRILNGSVSRYLTIALVVERNGSSGQYDGPSGSGVSYDLVPFYMVANDGNIMEHAVYFDGNSSMGGYVNKRGRLPTQAIAERYDIVVDFAQFAPGTKLYMVNLLEHEDGREPEELIPLADVLDGEYGPEVDGDRNRTDPAVTKFLEFRVHAYAGTDLSMNPAEYVAGNGLGPNGTDKTMIPRPTFTQTELDNAIHRSFEFGRSSGTDSKPWTIKTDGGGGLTADPRRLSAAPAKGSVEIWHLETGGGWSHPIHIHFEEGQILKRDGGAPPEWERWARKDVYRIGDESDSGRSVEVAIRFREFLGSFMEHCHNTQHEDHSMLLRWDLENPGQVRIMPTPMPSWDGVGYVPTFALPTFRTGDDDWDDDD